MAHLARHQWPATLLALRSRLVALQLVLLLVHLIMANRAVALVHFDFEQKYLVHPGVQVWDFSVVRDAGLYHFFYTSTPVANPSASTADSLFHATSPDLKHWTFHPAVITISQDYWDAGAVWAPDVFRDEAENRWVMAYTGVDMQNNQRICFAYSDDLFNWQKAVSNPTIVPDTSLYIWDPDATWSDFRDPFIYRENGLWHILVTAKKDLGGPTGVLFHAMSADLVHWQDVGQLFANDGVDKWRVLESSQYHVIGNTHYLLFGEYDTLGVTLLSASDPTGWTMANRMFLDYGYAPEVDEFDPGIRIYSRIANFYLPNSTTLGYVAKFDTLQTDADGANAAVQRSQPLDEAWATHSGVANLANPTFGDNPVYRGELGVGLVGNSYYGSAEYYQGPLSGRGGPGSQLGAGATGTLESRPFPVTGNRMTLLVGGGDYPATCYVALVDAADDAILRSETGSGLATMTPREWDLTPYQGRMCYVRIEDAETGIMGYINVDEIVEIADASPVGINPRESQLLRHQAVPNPCNPQTAIVFEMTRSARCEVIVYDVRGREVWRSGERLGHEGVNRIAWHGRNQNQVVQAAGTYLYGITVDQRLFGTGKISLVK